MHYNIDPLKKRCHLKVFTRIRPGFIEYHFKNINVDNFDIDKELMYMRLEVQAPWNGTMTHEKAEAITTPKG